jgi:hypothetical protein
MKLRIEVEVPDKTVEEVQLWTFGENEYLETDVKSEDIGAVEVFVAMYMSGKLKYTVVKADMTNKACFHIIYKSGYCIDLNCSNYYGKHWSMGMATGTATYAREKNDGTATS